jgi:hypothetical protein
MILQNAERAAQAATPEAFPNNIAVSFFTGDNVIQGASCITFISRL